MTNLDSIPELSKLYWILEHELKNVRLERKGNIRMVTLYNESRATTGSQEKIFDPIEQTSVNSAVGFWCFTPLFYDEHGRAIRKVPVGRGSWTTKDTNVCTSEGEKWLKRTLNYTENKDNTRNFKMTQYSLGDKGDQPKYAICQIFPLNKGAARDCRQRDLPQNQVVLPGNSTRPGDIADESNYIPPGHLNAPTETATVVASAPDQGPPLHDNLNKKRKLVIFDTSDGSEWTTEDDGEIGLFKNLNKSAQGQSTREIRQVQQYVGTEGNQATMQFQAPQHGAAGIVHESAMHQGQNLSHQPYCMPTQEGLHTNNQDCQVQFSGMADQWNEHDFRLYAPGESSTDYNLVFSDDDDIHTSGPQV